MYRPPISNWSHLFWLFLLSSLPPLFLFSLFPSPLISTSLPSCILPSFLQPSLFSFSLPSTLFSFLPSFLPPSVFCPCSPSSLFISSSYIPPPLLLSSFPSIWKIENCAWVHQRVNNWQVLCLRAWQIIWYTANYTRYVRPCCWLERKVSTDAIQT